MTEELTAIKQLNGLPATKEEQKQYAAKLKSELLSGNFNILHAHVFIKSVMDTIKDVLDDKEVNDQILEEARKYGTKTFDDFGAKITVAQKTTYDYSGIDPVYDALVKDMEKLKEQLKVREAVIKSGVDASTSETFAPPKTATTEYLTVKIQ